MFCGSDSAEGPSDPGRECGGILKYLTRKPAFLPHTFLDVWRSCYLEDLMANPLVILYLPCGLPGHGSVRKEQPAIPWELIHGSEVYFDLVLLAYMMPASAVGLSRHSSRVSLFFWDKPHHGLLILVSEGECMSWCCTFALRTQMFSPALLNDHALGNVS